MVKVSFWGGVGVIGSSKILIEDDGWRVLLDFGLDYHPGHGLFRMGVGPRPERALADRLRTDAAPSIPNLYKASALNGTGLTGGSDGKTAVFITHAHLDHIGLTGWVDREVPMFASPETIRVMDGLQQAGESVEGGVPRFKPMLEGQPLSFGPFQVRRYDVDHDIIGASGYAVDTRDGLVAFTGDIRLHGRHPEQSRSFCRTVAGARALIIEGTSLSFGFADAERKEVEVDQLFAAAIASAPGLILLTVYPRNLERVAAFALASGAAGRTMVWPPGLARFFRAMGLGGIRAWGEDIPLAEIASRPAQFIVDLESADWPVMLDLPSGPASVFLHANGEPLGPFDPRWDVLQDWLRFTHTPFWPIGTGGHASPDDLRWMVETVHPDIVFPLHSLAPDRLMTPPGTSCWLPQRGGRRYGLTKDAPG